MTEPEMTPDELDVLGCIESALFEVAGKMSEQPLLVVHDHINMAVECIGKVECSGHSFDRECLVSGLAHALAALVAMDYSICRAQKKALEGDAK